MIPHRENGHRKHDRPCIDTTNLGLASPGYVLTVTRLWRPRSAFCSGILKTKYLNNHEQSKTLLAKAEKWT